MYKEFISPTSYEFISRSVSKISLERHFEQEERGFWVCYGSFVLNLQNEKSDLDLLYVCDNIDSVGRIQSEFEGHPVTLYILSRKEFIADGEAKKYGGYFSGKVLNPHIVISKNDADQDLIFRVACEFIADFASSIGKQRGAKLSTSANLVADTILARFHICPWYANYFMRYFNHPRFSDLWRRMEETIPQTLIATKRVSSHGNGYSYLNTPGDDELHLILIKSIARFWSTGSYLHNSPYFLDTYIQKSDQYCKDPKALAEMKLFVKKMAGLGANK